jgi:hypothetical protein
MAGNQAAMTIEFSQGDFFTKHVAHIHEGVQFGLKGQGLTRKPSLDFSDISP